MKTVKINESETDDENNSNGSYKVNCMDKEGNYHYKIRQKHFKEINKKEKL